MKITENNYQIKRVIALEATGTAEGGANKPLFITAFNQDTGQSEEFVLKYRGSERMNEQRSARELIASFLAMALGISVPEPALVYIIPEFLDSLRHLRRGDSVVTSGGLMGKVTKVIDDEQIEVEIADGVRVRQMRSMVQGVRAKGEPAKDDAS